MKRHRLKDITDAKALFGLLLVELDRGRTQGQTDGLKARWLWARREALLHRIAELRGGDENFIMGEAMKFPDNVRLALERVHRDRVPLDQVAAEVYPWASYGTPPKAVMDLFKEVIVYGTLHEALDRIVPPVALD